MGIVSQFLRAFNAANSRRRARRETGRRSGASRHTAAKNAYGLGHKGKTFLISLVVIPVAILGANGDPLNDMISGQEIYEGRTRGSLADVDAHFPSLGLEVPASSFPCSSCHGADGEGGPRAPALSGNVLTQGSVIRTPVRRERAAYTFDTFRRAVTHGFDPSGNELSKTMPRFAFDQEHVSELWTYLTGLDAIMASADVDSSGCADC